MVRTRHIHCCGLGGQSLVEELRSRTPHGAAKLKKRRRKEKEIICGYQRWAQGEGDCLEEVKRYKLPLQSTYILGM